MTVVASEGIQFEIPDSWSYLTTPPLTEAEGYAGVNFRAASMAFPIDESSFASGTMGLLGPLDAAFVLQEEVPGPEVVPGQGYYDALKPENLTLVSFSDERLQVTRDGQYGYLEPFSASGRAFHIYAVLGSVAAAGSSLSAINGALSSLVVNPA